MDKWPAYARLLTVAPAGHLPTAPSLHKRKPFSGQYLTDKGVAIGREMGVGFGSDLTIRYTLPQVGMGRWSILVGRLAGCMAGRGMLEGTACQTLFARYSGDDGALAAASVNAAANGVPEHAVRQVLALLGEDPAELATRWDRWNQRSSRDRDGKPGEFLRRLIAIGKA